LKFEEIEGKVLQIISGLGEPTDARQEKKQRRESEKSKGYKEKTRGRVGWRCPPLYVAL
jgi:hypothetical protein